MFKKGDCLFHLDRHDDAIKACDACIEKFGNETDTEIKQIVALAIAIREKESSIQKKAKSVSFITTLKSRVFAAFQR